MSRRENSTPKDAAYGKAYEGPEVCVACVHHEYDNSEDVCKLNPPPQPVVSTGGVCSQFVPSRLANDVWDDECKLSLPKYRKATRDATATRLKSETKRSEPPME